jgi:hypothetical protein
MNKLRIWILAVLVIGFASNSTATEIRDDMIFKNDVNIAASSTYGFTLNGVEYEFPSADGTNGQVLKTDGSGTLSWTAAGGATAYDDIGNPDGNSAIDFTNYYVTWDSGDTDHDLFNFQGTGAFADYSVLRVEQVTGNATNGTVLEVVAADADVDPLVVSASGKANALVVGQDTGVVTIAGVAEGTDAVVVTAGDVTLTDGDLNVDGGDVVFAEDFEVNGIITMANDLTIDNSANNVLEINENSEELKVTFGSNTLDLASTSGINQLETFDNAAFTLTHAADGDSEDFTISQTGAKDSGLHLASAGTGADALTITTSAGGIDITVAGGAAGEDIDITTDTSINLLATENIADNITITANGGSSETIDITNTQGTNDAAFDINATAGGIDIDAAKSINIDSDESEADSISINSDGGIDIIAAGAGAGEDIDINTDASINIIASENQNNAVVIDASNAAGGIDIDAGTGGIAVDITGAADFRLDSSAGSIVLVGAEAAADAITIDAENAAGGIDMDFGTGGMVLTGTGSAANLTIDVDALSFDFTDSSNISVTSSEAAEDLTISQIGGNDSSIIITSAGTGANAIELTTSNAAGDIDINAGDAITVDAGDIVVTTDDTAANQFKVDATGAIDGDAVVFETTNGGVQINADGAAYGDIDIDAQDVITIVSTDTDGDGIYIHANGGTGENIKIHSDQGTGADSINIVSDAGGITLNGGSGGVVFTQGQTKHVIFTPKEFELDGTNPPDLEDYGSDGQTNISALEFLADGGVGTDEIAYISWLVPDGYVADSATLKLAYTIDTAEDGAGDEAQFDFAINAVAAGEALDAAGTALNDQTTVISDATADNGKLHVTEYNIEQEDIAVDDMVTIKIAVDVSASAIDQGLFLVLYADIEYESTE